MARGGRRQGTPGVSYANRTDLNTDRAPQTATTSAASGPSQAPPMPTQAFMTPDQVPKLDDPSSRPTEPITEGLSTGPGRGPEAIGAVPPNPMAASVEAAYLANPTPQLRRVILMMQAKGIR